MKLIFLPALLALLGGCVLNRPDHFYLLDSGQSATLIPRAAFAGQVTLHVSLPMLVDRSELVLLIPDGVQILEHERWASPLADQFTTVLGQDIEARRQDVIVSSQRMAQAGVTHVTMTIDVVQLSLRKGKGVILEARWRVHDEQHDQVSQGRESFSVPSSEAGIGGLVTSINACIAQLADRLVADIPQ